MSKNIQFSLSHDEIVRLCTILGVRENELGRTLKSSLLGFKHSPFFCEKIKIVKNDDKPIPLDEEAKKLTDDELRRKLGIRGNNENRKIKAQGLYYKKNCEDYLTDFILHWGGDWKKMYECIVTLHNMTVKEVFTQELVRREASKI